MSDAAAGDSAEISGARVVHHLLVAAVVRLFPLHSPGFHPLRPLHRTLPDGGASAMSLPSRHSHQRPRHPLVGQDAYCSIVVSVRYPQSAAGKSSCTSSASISASLDLSWRVGDPHQTCAVVAICTSYFFRPRW